MCRHAIGYYESEIGDEGGVLIYGDSGYLKTELTNVFSFCPFCGKSLGE